MNGILEKTKYYKCIATMLTAWLWRGKDFAESFMENYMRNIVQDSEKVCALAAGDLALVLYKVFDHLRFDTAVSPVTTAAVATYPRLTELQAEIAKLIVAEPVTATRAVKLTLLYILREAGVYEKSRDQSNVWILEALIPVGYNLLVRLSLKRTHYSWTTTNW